MKACWHIELRVCRPRQAKLRNNLRVRYGLSVIWYGQFSGDPRASVINIRLIPGQASKYT
ncbi:hypothetical protein GGR33_005189 [Methylobacterium brachythecii]|uniref:Uncharacterized protein n=1 Tax=Methylobacterium brachythecii TaxID=1176177 RepID=A0A7W6F9L5_9HYPH|nr:hypothetical protein [Methylobacterium brachythecii]